MIPKNIEEVTSGWLSECLGAPVRDFSHAQIGQGVGLMGDIYRINLDYENPQTDTPQSLVVKLPSSAESNRQQGVDLGMFEAEVRFYNELAPPNAQGLAKIYRAQIETGTADFVIVMEDLSDLVMVNQSEGMNLRQASAAVRVLAGLHALWWNKVQTPQFDWVPTMTGPRIQFVTEFLVSVLPSFEEKFSADLTDEQMSVFQRFAGHYLQINQQLAQNSPWTLAHQDFRVENLMFGSGESAQVMVLDWQGIGRGPGAYDLAYVLGGSMSSSLRRANEAALLQTYHSTLCEGDITDYSLDQLKADYATAQLGGGLATALLVGGSMDLSNERGRELAVTMARRHANAALDHDGLVRLAKLG